MLDKRTSLIDELRVQSTIVTLPRVNSPAGQDAKVVLLAEAAGGVMRHVIDLYKGLRSRNWRVQMILSPLRIETRYRDELSMLDQRDIDYVPMRRAPHATDLAAYSRISEILKSSPGDKILHSHSTKAGMIGALLHPRVQASILTPHAYRGVDPSSSPWFKALLHVAEGAYSKAYDRILTVAPAEMEYAKEIGVREEVLRCIPNGLDTSQIRFPEVFERRRQRGGRLCLGFVGRLVYQKNPILFLQILAEVVRRGRDACAIVVGDGPMKAEMLHVAQQLGIGERIDWRGDTPATKCLRLMDIMVHTSIYEALPYVLIEACADLLPIVATSNCGSEAVLRSRLPHSISSKADAGEMATILLSIAEDDSLRIKQSTIQARIAEEYSTDNMVNKIEAEYSEVLARSARIPAYR